MGASVAHHKNLSASVDGNSSAVEQNASASQTPVKEKPTSQKQRRKTFSSLGIRGSFDFRGGSFDVGSSKPEQCSPVAEEEKPPELTSREKELLTETWKELEGNIAKVGVITFVSLFETHPDVQQSFMSFNGVDIEDLKHSKQLRAHALRVMAFVQKAVARLHEPEKLETLLKELGKKHVTYGAKQKYVELVGPQFILAIKPSLEKQWDEELHEAWMHLFKIIEHIMVSSMDDEQKKIKSVKEYKEKHLKSFLLFLQPSSPLFSQIGFLCRKLSVIKTEPFYEATVKGNPKIAKNWIRINRVKNEILVEPKKFLIRKRSEKISSEPTLTPRPDVIESLGFQSNSSK